MTNIQKADSDLDFQLEPLENRRMMAADFAVSGNTLRITGDDANDTVAVAQDFGNVMVQLSEGGEFQDTGIAELDRLIINTGDGDDVVEISVDAERLARVNLGRGNDQLRFGGIHGRAIAVGGQGDDFITMAGVAANRGRIAGSAGDDIVGFDFAEYQFSAFSVLSEARVAIALGQGNDTFQFMFEDEIVGEGNIDQIGFDGVDTIPELIDELDGFGFGESLKGFRIVGGGGNDGVFGPGASDLIIGLGGRLRSFEDLAGENWE